MLTYNQYPSQQGAFYQLLEQGFVHPEVPQGTSLQEAIQAALDAVADHVLASSGIHEYVATLPKGPGTSCPNSPVDEIVRYLAYQKGQIDKSDPEVNLIFLNEHVRPVFWFERRAVQVALMRHDDVTAEERLLFDVGTHIADLHDLLWYGWFSTMAVHYQKLSKDVQERYREIVFPQLNPAPQYDYSVFDVVDGQVQDRVTWAVAFPEVALKIAELCMSLAESSIISDYYQRYFAALGAAYACCDVAKLDGMWTEVDTAWAMLPKNARFLPTHGMECGYEHPRCVSPEFRLDVRTGLYQKEIAECTACTVEHARAIGLSEEVIAEMKRRYAQLDMCAFVPVIRAGVALNFRYAGQQVPNRKDVADTAGMRIFLDTANLSRMTEVYAKELGKHCELGTTALLQPYVTDMTMQMHTITHELAHPVGRTEESDEALKEVLMVCLEEAKASLLGVLAEDWHCNDPEVRLGMIAVTIARLCRFLHKSLYENPTAQPYIRENISAFRTLVDAGVLHVTDSGFYVDEESARAPCWFDELRLLNMAILETYRNHDRGALEALTEQYCDTSFPPLQKAIAWVNRTVA